MKIFEKYNFDVRGAVLPLDSFRLFMSDAPFDLCRPKLDGIISGAKDDLVKEIPMLTLSQYRSYAELGSTSIYSKPYIERMTMLCRMTIAQLYEESDVYIDKILDVIWAILDESTWMLPEHTIHLPHPATKSTKVPAAVGEKYPHGLELGACYRASIVALAYYLFKDKFESVSPFINERIRYELDSRIISPFLNHRFWWEGVEGNRVNNWCPWNVANTLFTIALVEEDISRREEAVRLSMQFLDNFLNCYEEDGGCEEGPTYWNAAGGCLFDSLELIEDMTGGKITVYNEPLVKAIGEYLPRVNVTGRHFVNFADSRSTGGADGDMLIRYAEKCGSRVMRDFGLQMLKINPVYFDVKLAYRTLKSLREDVRDTDNAEQRAATDTYFPNLKVMVLRESECSERGMFLAIKGGHNGEMHNHNDVGSFIVYKDGNPVLIDAGVGEYTKQTFSKDRYKIWSMQSLYHNLPAFDKKGQLNGRNYASRDEVYDKAGRSLTMQLSDAYDESCGIKSLVRRASLNGSVASITDAFSLDTECLVEFTFMTHIKPRKIADGKILLNMDCTLCYDSALTADIEEFAPVGMEKIGSWGTEFLYRIRLSTTAKEGSYTFTVEG